MYPSKPRRQLDDPNLGEPNNPAIRAEAPVRPMNPSQGTGGAPRVQGVAWAREKFNRPTLQRPTVNAGVVAPPSWGADEVLKDQQYGKVAQGLRERLLRRRDGLSEQQQQTPFWKEFRMSPENTAARALSLIVSELAAGDRAAAFPQLGPEERKYLENSPVSMWLDWLDDVHATRGGRHG